MGYEQRLTSLSLFNEHTQFFFLRLIIIILRHMRPKLSHKKIYDASRADVRLFKSHSG